MIRQHQLGLVAIDKAYLVYEWDLRQKCKRCEELHVPYSLNILREEIFADLVVLGVISKNFIALKYLDLHISVAPIIG